MGKIQPLCRVLLFLVFFPAFFYVFSSRFTPPASLSFLCPCLMCATSRTPFPRACYPPREPCPHAVALKLMWRYWQVTGLGGIDHQEGEETRDETKLNCSLLNEGFLCFYPATYMSISGSCKSAAVNQVILSLVFKKVWQLKTRLREKLGVLGWGTQHKMKTRHINTCHNAHSFV